jgi:hypothetical protein
MGALRTTCRAFHYFERASMSHDGEGQCFGNVAESCSWATSWAEVLENASTSLGLVVVVVGVLRTADELIHPRDRLRAGWGASERPESAGGGSLDTHDSQGTIDMPRVCTRHHEMAGQPH